MGEKILLLIPAYNEEKRIGIVLDEIRESGWMERADVLVVNDGSLDKTNVEAKKHGAFVINQIYNMGYGSALQTGYKYAVYEDYDYVIQLDADGQHPVSNLDDLLKCIKEKDNIDIVIGSRFYYKHSDYPVSGLKKFAIFLLKKMIYKVSGQNITDPTSGLQILNRNAFAAYAKYGEFDTKYPDANMIIQMLMRGYHIVEIPAKMKLREGGTSMHSGLKPMLYGILMIISMITVYIREKFV